LAYLIYCPYIEPQREEHCWRHERFTNGDGCYYGIALTTAGAFSPEPLRCAIDAMGLDCILFSVDYPLQDSGETALFIETAPLSEAEREAVCFRNAERLLRL
jgi:predicted TIM-barrel fold metal-dependent hydrolase